MTSTNIISNGMVKFSGTEIGTGVRTERIMETIHSQWWSLQLAVNILKVCHEICAEIGIIFKQKLRSETVIPWCYVDFLRTEYTQLLLMKLQVKQNIHCEILMVAIGPSHVRESFYVRYLQTKQLKNLCTLSVAVIWLQEIMLCIEPWNNSTLWVLCDISWLIWSSQVPEQYLGLHKFKCLWILSIPFSYLKWKIINVCDKGPRSGFELSSYIYQLWDIMCFQFILIRQID